MEIKFQKPSIIELGKASELILGMNSGGNTDTNNFGYYGS